MRPARSPMGAGEWWICRRLIEYISPTHTTRPFLVKGEGCSPLVAYGAYLIDLGQLEIRIKTFGLGVTQAILTMRDEMDASVVKEFTYDSRPFKNELTHGPFPDFGTRVAHGAAAGFYVDYSLPQFLE